MKTPGLVDRHEHGQLLAAADLEVLGAAAGRDVDDAGALVEHDVGVGDDTVDDLGLRGQVVEAGRVGTAHEVGAAHAPDDLRVRAEHGLAAILGDDAALALVLDPDVVGIGLDGRGHVGGSVHGVVVHTTSASPGASVKRKRTYSDSSTMSR